LIVILSSVICHDLMEKCIDSYLSWRFVFGDVSSGISIPESAISGFSIRAGRRPAITSLWISESTGTNIRRNKGNSVRKNE
ncbi:MAG: hypothetical protein IJ665_11435, partial [Phocaeicola sp.]|nr:hypothetical protein [Phocaeicola sp.]